MGPLWDQDRARPTLPPHTGHTARCEGSRSGAAISYRIPVHPGGCGMSRASVPETVRSSSSRSRYLAAPRATQSDGKTQ